MARKSFSNIDIFSGIAAKNGQDWQKEAGITANWRTPEQIDIQPRKTSKAWSTSTLLQVSLPSCVAPIA